MSQFTRAVFFKDGKCLTITEHEAEQVKERLLDGDKFVEVQGNLFSADSVSRVGEHQSTAEINKTNRNEAELLLQLDGNFDAVDKRRKLEERLAIENKLKEKTLVGQEYLDWIKKNESLEINSPQTDDEVINGNPAYYLDEVTGEKMYS